VQDIENTVLTTSNGAPVRVKDIAIVEWGCPSPKFDPRMTRPDFQPWDSSEADFLEWELCSAAAHRHNAAIA
jgi:hypothetical protein